LYDFDDDICLVVNSYGASPFHFRSVTPSLSKVSVDIDKIYFSPLYMRLICQGTSPPHPPLYPLSSSSGHWIWLKSVLMMRS
jgi:hypothetical protein